MARKITTDLINLQNVRDIISTASMGIVSWSDEALASFDRYSVHDREKGTWHIATHAQIREAVVEQSELRDALGKAFDGWTEEGGIDTTFIDSIEADRIIQRAALGEIVYG